MTRRDSRVPGDFPDRCRRASQPPSDLSLRQPCLEQVSSLLPVDSCCAICTPEPVVFQNLSEIGLPDAKSCGEVSNTHTSITLSPKPADISQQLRSFRSKPTAWQCDAVSVRRVSDGSRRQLNVCSNLYDTSSSFEFGTQPDQIDRTLHALTISQLATPSPPSATSPGNGTVPTGPLSPVMMLGDDPALLSGGLSGSSPASPNYCDYCTNAAFDDFATRHGCLTPDRTARSRRSNSGEYQPPFSQRAIHFDCSPPPRSSSVCACSRPSPTPSLRSGRRFPCHGQCCAALNADASHR